MGGNRLNKKFTTNESKVIFSVGEWEEDLPIGGRRACDRDRRPQRKNPGVERLQELHTDGNSCSAGKLHHKPQRRVRANICHQQINRTQSVNETKTVKNALFLFQFLTL